MGRLLIVSNRLPVTLKVDGSRISVAASAGGLATGLKKPHQERGGLWIGWPGETARLDPNQKRELEAQLDELRCAPIYLSPGEVQHFYEGFSNGVLWPLFHYLLDRVPADARDWDAYRRVNERFADAVVAHAKPGDTIWVQDYQLMLLPRLLRERLPAAKIGFFLHIPFPSVDVFRILPWREEVLRGLLGADLVGFHTFNYVRHFAKSVVRLVGGGLDVDRIHHDGREVRLGVFPMGVDAARFEELGSSEAANADAARIRGDGSCKILLGIDRLDYTKGISRRLLAFERLLEREPQRRGKVRLVQVAVPSRTKVDAYASFRRQVDEQVGRINGAFGGLTYQPIHYLYRGYSEAAIAAMYRAADAMLVTPLRDGMNLVAKEFVAARKDGDGVLVLSEFAGAYSELGEALICNPYDIEGMSRVFSRALSLPEEERRTRMKALRARVLAYDINRWANSFLEMLDSTPARVTTAQSNAGKQDVDTWTARARNAASICLFLDYDGSLRPLASTPELAQPTQALGTLLTSLAARPATEVHVVSGRPRHELEAWFGELDVSLHAEHGAFSRSRITREWKPAMTFESTWREPVRAILAEFVARTPGSRLEEKSASMAWHYRLADPEFGPIQARELALHLTDVLSNAPVEVLQGDKVVEIRHHGVNKGLVIAKAIRHAPPGTFMIAIGDDRTDEDMFAALAPLGESGLSVRVGRGATQAMMRVADPAAVHSFLEGLIGGAERDGA